MSSSDPAVWAPAPTARLEVTAGLPNVQIIVSDGLFREVARGTGALSLTAIPAGLYKVEARAGGTTESRLVSLRPGEHVTQTVTPLTSIPTIAPVSTGATSHPQHREAAIRGTHAVGRADGPPSGLVVLVRTLPGHRPDPLAVDRLALVDHRLCTVNAFNTGWAEDASDHWAMWAGRLDPGGYALRTGDVDQQAVDQSLWLSRDWVTIVFCTTGPTGPRIADGAVHMLELGTTWEHISDHLASVHEVALSGLRQGMPLISHRLMRDLLNAKFFDPMLGIIGAHALRLRQPEDPDLLRLVVHNLGRLVPDHPDAQALWYAVGRTGPRRVSWPPMLAASYLDLLLPAEYTDPRVLADRSVAERIAAYLTGGGVWLSWRVDDEILGSQAVLAEQPPATSQTEPNHPGGPPVDHIVGDIGLIGSDVGPTRPDMVPTTGRPRLQVPTAALRTVERYLDAAERILKRPPEQIARDLGVTGLARRTNLPYNTVAASLAELDLPTRHGEPEIGTGSTPPSVGDHDVQASALATDRPADEQVSVPVLANPVWHLAPRSAFALAANTEPARDPLVDDDGRGLRVVRQPLSNGKVYIGLEVSDPSAAPGQLLRVDVGPEDASAPLFFVLVDSVVLRGDLGKAGVLASEMVLASDVPWPELWVAHLPAVDPATLTDEVLAVVPRSVAAASLPCKEAWRKLALAAPADGRLRDAVRAGLTQPS